MTPGEAAGREEFVELLRAMGAKDYGAGGRINVVEPVFVIPLAWIEGNEVVEYKLDILPMLRKLKEAINYVQGIGIE